MDARPRSGRAPRQPHRQREAPYAGIAALGQFFVAKPVQHGMQACSHKGGRRRVVSGFLLAKRSSDLDDGARLARGAQGAGHAPKARVFGHDLLVDLAHGFLREYALLERGGLSQILFDRVRVAPDGLPAIRGSLRVRDSIRCKELIDR